MGLFGKKRPTAAVPAGAADKVTFVDAAASAGVLADLSPEDSTAVLESRLARLDGPPAEEAIFGMAPARLVAPIETDAGVFTVTSHRAVFMANSGSGLICFYPGTLIGTDPDVVDRHVHLILYFNPELDWLVDPATKEALAAAESAEIKLVLGTGTTPPSVLLKPLQRFVGA
jgi:hypothetical protein